MEEITLRVLDGTVGRRDVKLPGQVGGRPEGFFVEEVPPSPDRLPEGQARRRNVQVAKYGKSAPPRVAAANEHPADHAAVDREAALPDCEDLRRELTVVVEVEQDVIEPGTD